MKVSKRISAAAVAAIILIAAAAFGCGSDGNTDYSGNGATGTDAGASTITAGASTGTNGDDVSTVSTSAQNVADPGPAPAEVSGLTLLPSAVAAEQSFSDDSIAVVFFMQGFGTFTVQEMTAGSWKTTRDNVSYQGTGGLEAGTMPPGADSITLRLLKVENGQYSGVTREITVRRADVMAAGGLKIYQN